MEKYKKGGKKTQNNQIKIKRSHFSFIISSRYYKKGSSREFSFSKFQTQVNEWGVIEDK